jgi:alanyl-tRNA synthetase
LERHFIERGATRVVHEVEEFRIISETGNALHVARVESGTGGSSMASLQAYAANAARAAIATEIFRGSAEVKTTREARRVANGEAKRKREEDEAERMRSEEVGAKKIKKEGDE